jgi:hydrogenase expression/formation protein HypC
MCLAMPAQIESIDGVEAKVDIGGVNRIVNILFTPEAQVGDYVYVHTGYAISVLDEEEALESLKLLRELAETYPEEGLFQARVNLPGSDTGTSSR